MIPVSEVFDDGDSWTGPPLTDAMVSSAERTLAVKLPESYLELLRYQNGGVLRRNCFRTSFPTSWSHDHFSLVTILGIGGEFGIDTDHRGSSYLIQEWGYPEIGVVIGVTESAGPDTVMLDYRECGPAGEPAVSYVGEDRVPHVVARTFGEFIDGLLPCDEFDDGFD
jgi:hypothetical protein